MVIKRNNDKHINKLKEIFIKTEKRKWIIKIIIVKNNN